MAAEPKPELERSLEELRREIIEARNLVIKSDNALKNVFAELKQLSKRQEELSRKQWFNSVSAYLAVGAIGVVALLLLNKNLHETTETTKAKLAEETAAMQRTVSQAKADAEGVASAEKGASELYKQLSSEKIETRLAGIEAYQKLDVSKLPMLEKKLLQDRVKSTEEDIRLSALERGKTAYARKDYGMAAGDLTRYLTLLPSGSTDTEAMYFLGVSLALTKKHDDAIVWLSRYVQADKKGRSYEYAMFLLMQSYDSSKLTDKAVETAKEALANRPLGEFSGSFRQRLLSRTASAPVETPVETPAVRQPLKPAEAPKPAVKPETH